MKFKMTLLFLLLTTFMSAQQLTNRSRGRVFDSNSERLSSKEVRKVLAPNAQSLRLYNQGRSKKTLGNVLLLSGVGVIFADFAINWVDNNPSLITPLGYAGVALIIVSIPVKVGFTKKIKDAVQNYNKTVASQNDEKFSESVSIIADQNGVGLKMTF